MSASHRLALATLLVLPFLPLCASSARSLQVQESQLDPLLLKLGQYVASYGEKTSALVAIEKYTQTVTTAEGAVIRPRQLVAEFAIIKTDGGWVGYRDVVRVNNQTVTERRDRLLTLLTSPSADTSEFSRIANESARYNIGPVETNLNVPTTTLFFFRPVNLHRFVFTRNRTARIEGVETVEFDFKETAVPTLVMKRDGTNVPVEGTLWIAADGAVVRSRLRLRGFADTATTKLQAPPQTRPAVNPNIPTGGRPRSSLEDPIDLREITSAADIDVIYALHAGLGLWLPSKMSERYEGAIKLPSRAAFQGVSTTRASYSEYKQFGTGARILIPKVP
jgi:hypothetical protein